MSARVRVFVRRFSPEISKLLLFGVSLLASLNAATLTNALFVGFNGATPLQIYAPDGTYLQDFGPSGTSAVVPDGAGNYFGIQPNVNGTSAITRFDSSQNALGAFTIPDLIVDGANGANNTLWLSSYSGKVYNVSQTGSILKSWTTAGTDIGVAFDGTFVYTTSGNGASNLIEKWAADGTSVGTVATPFNALYGLGYDSTTGDFWAGSNDFLYEISPAGALLVTLDIPGDARTPSGALHDGLEVGSFAQGQPTGVPEPASVFFSGVGLALVSGFFLIRRRKLFVRIASLRLISLRSSSLWVTALLLGSITAAFSAVTVQLTPSIPGSAPVGSAILWTATATDTTNSSATFAYQFSVAFGGATEVRRDYSAANTFAWSPVDQEGSYNIEVAVRSSTGSSTTQQVPYLITSRVSGTSPVVTPTDHPLVALYSVPSCATGRLARVRFKAPGDIAWQFTPFKTCTGNTSLNFLIGGMRANTTYSMQQDVFNGPFDAIGPILSFATRTVPNFFMPPYSEPQQAASPNNLAYDVVFTATAGVQKFDKPIATDTQGRLIWYLPVDQPAIYITRPVPGGTILGIFNGAEGNRRMLREYDLVGDLVRETNATIVSQQLVAMGTDPITEFHHEAVRFPNGDTAVLGSVERVADQGAGPVDVLGDMVIVLDRNLQVKWFWNEFDQLDIHRRAILNETCTSGAGGCPTLRNPGFTVANDWTHSNSLALTPDGNMIVSVRHQDWVIKFDYRNGAGTGVILWRLGNNGDFSVNSTDPNPWFSHQHDAEFESNGLLTVFDNGNTRNLLHGGNSRGQAWRLDEANKIATPVVNIDVGAFSVATGSAQLLSNGNYHFDLGFINGSASASEEYTPTGVLQFEQLFPSNVNYRSFRLKSLYAVQ